MKTAIYWCDIAHEQNALDSIRSLIEDDNEISLVFMHHSAVESCQGQFIEQWKSLNKGHNISLKVCINSVNSFGIKEENVPHPFEIASLLDLIEAEANCQQVIQINHYAQ